MTLPVKRIETRILIIRGHRVMIDTDLAELYGVSTKALNQAVKRNAERFPEDFMFRLTPEEADSLRAESVTFGANLKSQSVTSRWGGRRRSTPNAFTEQGVAMLSSVLQSPRAVQVNISIMRAFVAIRRAAASHAALSRRLDELERKHGVHDEKLKIVFRAIRELMESPKKARRRIGF
jgi:ORF6N domain